MPEYAEFEVVSPGGRKGRDAGAKTDDPLFALIAKWMDDVFVIPGTNIRFGIDPLIGLLPGMGDSSGAIISALLIFRGARAGLPRIVLLRMALNVLVNTAVGALPVVGDIFSVWFKSNRLNYELWQRHADNAQAAHGKDWLFVTSLLAGLLLAVAGIITLSVLTALALWKYLIPTA